MACQSYFIVLTVCTCDARNIHRLRPSVGLAQTCPNKTRLYIFQIKCKTVKYINHGVYKCNKISGPHCTHVLEAQLDSCNWAFRFINLSTPQSKFMWCFLYSSIKCMLSNFRKFLLAWLMEIIWT